MMNEMLALILAIFGRFGFSAKVNARAFGADILAAVVGANTLTVDSLNMDDLFWARDLLSDLIDAMEYKGYTDHDMATATIAFDTVNAEISNRVHEEIRALYDSRASDVDNA